MAPPLGAPAYTEQQDHRPRKLHGRADDERKRERQGYFASRVLDDWQAQIVLARVLRDAAARIQQQVQYHWRHDDQRQHEVPDEQLSAGSDSAVCAAPNVNPLLSGSSKGPRSRAGQSLALSGELLRHGEEARSREG